VEGIELVLEKEGFITYIVRKRKNQGSRLHESEMPAGLKTKDETRLRAERGFCAGGACSKITTAGVPCRIGKAGEGWENRHSTVSSPKPRIWKKKRNWGGGKVQDTGRDLCL